MTLCTRSGRVVQNRSSVLKELPSYAALVGEDTNCESEKSRRSWFMRVPAVFIEELGSQDGCFALKSPIKIVVADSDSALDSSKESVLKKLSTEWSGGR